MAKHRAPRRSLRTRRPRPGSGLLAGLLAAGIAAGGVAGAGIAVAATTAPHPTQSFEDVKYLAWRTYHNACGPLVIDVSKDEQGGAYARWIDALIAKGWHGRAGDGMEALYAPGC